MRSVILDGEAIALGPDDRPLPFQVTASRAARRTGTSALSLRLFDCLHLDGVDLIDHPASERAAALASRVPAALCVPRALVHDAAGAEAALAIALGAGHEGLVLKALDAPYEAGRRGGTWLKVKPRHTLDLVVLAVEWGSGRRRGLLSNLHLGARDPDGGFVMLGKTFKGMTDEMLRWQTETLLELEVERSEHVVRVRPELVVEIAFDGVQTSTRYPGGVALRFARVVRYRPDKQAAEADTLHRSAEPTIVNLMVQYSTTVDRAFAALADPTRRAVLERLGSGSATISELAEPFGMSLTGMKKHIRLLEEAQLVTTEKVGRVRRCMLAPYAFEGISTWLQRLDRFAQVVERTKGDR